MLGDVQLIEENGSIYAECDNAAGRLYEGLQAMMLTMLMKPSPESSRATLAAHTTASGARVRASVLRHRMSPAARTDLAPNKKPRRSAACCSVN